MKLKTLFNTLLATAALNMNAHAAADFIIQTDIETGLTQHIYVHGPDSIGEKSGTEHAAFGIGPSGSQFKLYGIGLEPDTNLYLLDETIAGSFLPKAVVSITSDDPYNVVPRMRADQSFRAKLTFSKLLNTPEAPESARRVYVERIAAEYPEGSDRAPADRTERVIEAFYVDKNGELEGTFSTSLYSPIPYKQKGEEFVRVYALPDSNLGWTLLDEKKVQVWPIADGEITGSAQTTDKFTLHDKTFTYVPKLHMSVKDLYPTSKTYLNVYKGQKNDNPTNAQQISSQILANDYEPVAFNTIVPQSANQTIEPEIWQDFATEDGQYTVEILTETPFNQGNPQRIVYATFNLKRTIQINAHISSVE